VSKWAGMANEAHHQDDTLRDRPRVIFFGTPAFARTCLEAIYELVEIALVVTQPDRGSGRGLKVTASPVKAFAQDKAIPFVQPSKVRPPEFAQMLREVRAELGVVVAYGRILPPPVLEAPRLGCINVHASLLPKLRGAAPIEWAIINGETETGVCLMQLDQGMDTGPVYGCARCPIDADETGAELSAKLAELGASFLASNLDKIWHGELKAEPQLHERATLAPILSKEHGLIVWSKPARAVHNLVRGVNPWPGAYTYLEGKRVLVHRTRVLDESSPLAEPGTILKVNAEAIEVSCVPGALAVLETQAEGKRRMPAAQFAAGHRLKPGMRFDNSPPSND
jgi:methionyl-tRNA formyltransferase